MSEFAAELQRLATLQPSAESGSPEDQCELADEYMELEVLAPDKKSQDAVAATMYRYYKMAADRGYAEAQMRVGLAHLPCSMDGEPIACVEEDLSEGLRWLERAVAQEGEESEAAYYAAKVKQVIKKHCGSPVLRNLQKFEYGIPYGAKHPDPEYAAFRQMSDAKYSSWDGSCDITAIRRTAAEEEGSTDLSTWAGTIGGCHVEYEEDYGWPTEFKKLAGRSVASVVEELVDGKGVDTTFGVRQSDDIDEVRGVVAAFEERRLNVADWCGDPRSPESDACAEALFRLVEKCGSLGEAMLPDGNAPIVEVSHEAWGGNNRSAAFATQDWFFVVDMDMS